MKRINILIITLALGLLSSCKTGFYTQKYTNLRPLKTPVEKVDVSTINQAKIGFENDVQVAELENVEALISKEDQKQIQDAIAKEVPIYVVTEKEIYRLVNPIYDQFYNAVSGSFQPITDKSYLEDNHLELFQDDFVPSRIDPFIYMNNISAVLDYKVVVALQSDPEPKENRIDSTKTITETAVVSEKGDGSRVSLAEHYSAKYVVKQKRNSIIAGAALLLGVALFVIAISAGSFATVFILGLFIIGLYITVLIALIGALMSNQRNRVSVQKRGFKVNQRANSSAAGLWILLIFMSLPLLLIPVLIALIAVACI